MTPKQIMAYFRLAAKRRRAFHALNLSIAAVAARGDAKAAVEKLLNDADHV